MTSIQDTIREYTGSCHRLRTRIDELNEEIGRHSRHHVGTGIRTLEGRRYQLYCELAQMEESIAEMRDYLAAADQTPATRQRCVRRRKYR